MKRKNFKADRVIKHITGRTKDKDGRIFIGNNASKNSAATSLKYLKVKALPTYNSVTHENIFQK